MAKALVSALRCPPLLTSSALPCNVLRRGLKAASHLGLKGRHIGLRGFLMLAIPGTTFCLGCWQVQRQQWKRGLIVDLETKVNLPPVPLPELLSELDEMEYNPVYIRGTFDHSREILYGPRPRLRQGKYDEASGGLISAQASGFLVVTPFILTESGETILVNRGWVPKKNRSPSTREEGQVTGEQQLTAIVRLQERRPAFMPKAQGISGHFTYRDVASMSELTNTLPVFVDACEGVQGGPVGGQTRVTLRDEHTSYIITWYTLTLLTTFMWYRRFINPRALF